jgi:hypothetical protein
LPYRGTTKGALNKGFSEEASKRGNFFETASMVDKEMQREGYVKENIMPRPRGVMKKASAGGRKRVQDDITYICEQPGHKEYNCPKQQTKAPSNYKAGQSSKQLVPS